MKRVVIPELLDTDSGTASELENAFADLRMFNRWFGGCGASSELFRRVAAARNAKEISVLEVAAGSGAGIANVQHRLNAHGPKLRVTLLDRAISHLRQHPRNGTGRIAGDAVALPFHDGSFDVVSCDLFLHHLEPDDVVRFTDEALRVARLAVVINDLRRHPLHLALAYAGFVLYRSRLTQNDAPASVRRAYTEDEMRKMLARTRAREVEISHHYLFRMGVIAWK